MRLGVTLSMRSKDDGSKVLMSSFCRWNDSDRYDLVIGADGVYSQTCDQTAVSRCWSNPQLRRSGGVAIQLQDRPDGCDRTVRAYEGPIGMGLVPLSDELMYMYRDHAGAWKPALRTREGIWLKRHCVTSWHPTPHPRIAELRWPNNHRRRRRCLQTARVAFLLDGDWHKGRVVLHR